MKNKQESNKSYHVIGLMSGSSLDGLDIVYSAFTYSTSWQFKILKAKTAPLGKWAYLLKNASNLNAKALEQLSKQFAHFLAEETQLFIDENAINTINLIASHGHTIFHYPAVGKTCQIGNGRIMTSILKVPVLTNLRQADIDAGGQGAPIVPIGDLHLFNAYKFCLNIGGIANISVKQNDRIIAYDIAMANQILNYFSQKLGKAYDDEGKLAASAKVNKDLLHQLNQLDFYKRTAPKSLDNGYKNKIIALLERSGDRAKNHLATYTNHLAKHLAKEINTYAKNEDEALLVSGGGAYNKYLIQQIQKHTKVKLVVPNKEIIDYKEALVMAFMAVLYLEQTPNVLASVTGASKDTICGELHELR